MLGVVRKAVSVGLVIGLSLATLASGANAQGRGDRPGGGGGGGDPAISEYYKITQLDEASIAARLNGIKVLDPQSPLGDVIDLNMGSLSFSHTDVSIPGNSGLPVAFGRNYSLDSNDISDNIFGGWNPDVPYLTATVAIRDVLSPTNDLVGWVGSDCMVPPFRVSSGAVSTIEAFRSANAFWQGLNMHIPGNGNKLVLRPASYTSSTINGVELNVGTNQDWLPVFTGAPASAGAARTQDHWILGCHDDGRFGAVAHAPNGWKYYFDHVVQTRAGERTVLRQLSNEFTGNQGTDNCSFSGPRSDCLTVAPRLVDNFNVMATRIEDQHGNWVAYEYDGMRLISITSNDGRRIDFTYEAVTYNTQETRSQNGHRLKTISAHGRTWTFDYTVLGIYSHLTEITLPDGRTWEFDLPPMRVMAESHPCYRINRSGREPKSYTVKGPSGLVAQYNTELRRFGKSGVPYKEAPDIAFDGTNHAAFFETCDDYEIPTFSVARSVISKTYAVPEAGDYTWQYVFQDDEGWFDQAGQSGPDFDLRRSEMIDPEGDRTVAFYNRRFQTDDEGLVAKREYYDGETGALLETTLLDYDKGPQLGWNTLLFEYSPPVSHERPIKQMVTIRDGVSYTTDYTYNFTTTSANYSFGAPTLVTRSSPLQAEARTEATTYTHLKPAWILALPDTVTRNGKLFDAYTYNSIGQTTRRDRFGDLLATYAYHPDGTVMEVENAINQSVSLPNYYRGVPTSVIRPDGTSISRTVSDYGQVLSETDARGNTTSYAYDTAGRPTLMVPPGSLASTNISYSNLNSGIVMTATTGSKQTITSYDGFYRPYLVEERALSGGGGSIFTKTEYDGLNREVFTSFPSETLGATSKGLETYYDGLGRTIRTRENVAPFATSTTVYQPNNQTQVTDPNGNVTTTSSSGYGSPTDGNILRVDQPEGVSTIMTYDVFGNLLTANQGGIQQSWAYNNRLLPCRHTAPETGSRRYVYNSVDQMITMSEGEGFTAGCASPTSAISISHSYDELGRMEIIDYADATPDTVISYDENGNVTSKTRGGSVWTYEYDPNSLLTKEKLEIDGRIYEASYVLDANGYLTSYSAPTGRLFTYSNDGHGRQTRVRHNGVNYANGGRYHANGQLEFFGYANGFRYRSSQNARQQPLRTHVRRDGTSIYVTDFNYTYDANGMITAISDGVDSNESRTFTYDGVSRLTSASGPWGDVAYTYDTRNNLLSKVFTNGGTTTRTVNMLYNSSNRMYRYNDTDTTGGTNKNVAYDERGNVKNNGRQRFTYDLSNHPFETFNGGVNSSFQYDGNYKRVKQTINGETIYTVYSSTGTILIRDNVTTGEITEYVRLGSLTVGEIKNGVIEYMYNDHLGTPVAGSDQSRNILWRDSRLPYGESMSVVSERSDRVGYTGHIEDSALKLTYMQARYYDPVLGRFLSNDPVGFSEGAVDYFNRYAYTSNNPVNRVDPDGEFWGAHIVIGIAVGAVVGVVSEGIDVATGGEASIGGFVGAAVGGAVSGGTLAACAGACGIGSGALGGGVDSIVRQTIDNGIGGVNLTEVAIETGAGAAGGIVSKIPGIDKGASDLAGLGGNGGIAHVADTQTTKLVNGTTRNISAGTGAKIAATNLARSAPNVGANAGVNASTRDLANQLPEASLNCALVTSECGDDQFLDRR